jgi:hypothetical protein
MPDARRNVYIPDDDWRRAERLAVALAQKDGRPVSVSEAIRRAVEALAKRLKVS